ncbi:MAG: pyrimidine/purine nucleoside phosphorylase [Candidatus Cloacimonadaceae bacterium]|jgi:uncharacterized protein YaiE (UPF0345 family)|nr:pyrimidine/purine nucleoside phosphorylase [Candidatus Cloacimonadota bacterium]MCB5258300.1 pyrimidine/purine nucleoside phosphorylase [Candidatus Cloacimonadota bacterium]MDD5624604.1 pyrimidine/purine nucleoside phosphorylase [Candidatus Cloacimonadota bacterium]MDY0111486.1 pyrimidine/purine nucleoside phosphorylase [Candidatus Syntrophosphaera sp.]
MLKVFEYFEGKVKSIAFENSQGIATVGVMDKGEYEFATTTIEYMTVISGILTVLLPDSKQWKAYGKGESFMVPADKKYKVKASEQTAYYCRYE